MMKKYLAEFLGTLILTLVVIASIFTAAGWPTAVLVGFALVVIVLMVGAVSGAHVNPGITLGALSVGRIGKRDALFYIIAQLLGGLAAYGISLAFGHVMPEFITDFSVMTLIAEVIGMTVFAFGVASAMSGSRGQGVTAVLVGGSLMVGAYISGGLGSYGLLNPAIALGVSIWGVAYLVGPPVGGVLGMWLHKVMNSAK